MSAPSPTVAVVVPTRNSARTLEACLLSLREQRLRPMIVVVDNYSTDESLTIAQTLADITVVAGPERSAQRNRGAAVAVDAEVLGFVDSDMVVDPDVVAQVLTQLEAGYDGVVVPEHTMGSGFVARVRAFERAQYVGASQVEAARFFTRRAFDAVGGFDEALNAGEDWDLSLRMLEKGASLGHVQAHIWHDEARIGFLAHCAKKGRYATGLRLFLAKHGTQGRAVVMDRPYLRRPWTLLRHPILGSGLVFLKIGEAGAVLAVLARQATTVAWARPSPDVNSNPRATTRSDHLDPAIGPPSGGVGAGHPAGPFCGSSSSSLPTEGQGEMASTTCMPSGRVADPPLRCVLAVPAHNEQDALVKCLDALAAAPLPPGVIWDAWVLLDGGSTDRTVEHWRAWETGHPDMTLRVQHSARRLGKAVELEQLRRLLVARQDPNLLMVVCDADTTVAPSAFVQLLRPFLEDREMAVVWGVTLPHGPKKGRRASSFQARLAVAAAELLGPRAIRADGRLFAIRPSLLNGFSWQSGHIADDTQLAGYVRDSGVPHSSECSAVTYATPARGWRDLYLQTYRYYAAKKILSSSGMCDFPATQSHGKTARLHDGTMRVQIRAFAREATSDPRGAIAYAIARGACVVIHRFVPAKFADAWPQSKTTKSMTETASPSIESLGLRGSVVAALRAAGEKIYGNCSSGG